MAKHIVVIGAGPAGMEAARSAARHGARVTLIGTEEPGGRATWHSLLPSKKWLMRAQTQTAARDTDFSTLLQDIRQAKKSWAAHNVRELGQLGVRILTGRAKYMHAGRIDVFNEKHEKLEELCPDASIISSGSVPVFPDPLKPDGRRVIAPRFMSSLNKLPASMAVVGGGVSGTEFAYLFASLGVRVDWFIDSFGLLPGFDTEISSMLKTSLESKGITLHEPVSVKNIIRREDRVIIQTDRETELTSEMAFVAIGRTADVNHLGLSVLEKTPSGVVTLKTDAYGRTQFESIYAVGDVVSPQKSANRAMAQAYIAGAHAAGAQTVPFDDNKIIAAVYTDPALAQVGTLKGRDIRTWLLPYSHAVMSHICNSEGWVKIALNGQGDLCGAAALGPEAAEVITPAILIMQGAMSPESCKALFPANPTYGEIFFEALRHIPV